MNLGLIWGLGAAVAWGTADFCAKKATAVVGFWPTLWGMNLVGALALGAVWMAGGAAVPAGLLPALAALGVGNTVGGVLFYFALEFGPLVLVSPITAAFPVVAGALAFWLAGERLSPAMALAAAGVVAGTVLASIGGPSSSGSSARTGWALLAAAAGAVTFGAVFFGLAEVAGRRGVSFVLPVLVFRGVGSLLLALPLLWGARPRTGWLRCPWIWATGLLDSFAYLFYAAGARRLPVAVIASLSGLFCVWTLALAVPLLGERLRARQWAGVALIVAAIAALGFAHRLQ